MQPHKPDPKQAIIAAATAILDSYGIADLTMRRLARELGLTPGALYWHFTNKQQLLGAVADEVLQPVRGDPRIAAETGWRRRVVLACTRLRAALLAHTDGAELVSASFAAGQSAGVVELLRLLAGAAAEAGLDGVHAELAARTLLYYVLGATADEQSRSQWRAAGTLPAEPASPATGFEFGLRLLIDGLAAQSAPPAADRMLGPLVAVPPA